MTLATSLSMSTGRIRRAQAADRTQHPTSDERASSDDFTHNVATTDVSLAINSQQITVEQIEFFSDRIQRDYSRLFEHLHQHAVAYRAQVGVLEAKIGPVRKDVAKASATIESRGALIVDWGAVHRINGGVATTIKLLSPQAKHKRLPEQDRDRRLTCERI